MSAHDLWEDGYPHGTPAGFRGGCRGSACPAATEIGMSCRQADIWSHGNQTYRRLAAQGATPAEIAAAIRGGDTTPTVQETTVTTATVTDEDVDVALPQEEEVELRDDDDLLEDEPPLEQDAPDVDDTIIEPTDDSTTDEPVESTPDTQLEVFRKPTHPRYNDGLSTDDRRTIRAWAKTNGYDVSTRGALSRGVVLAYERTQQPAEAPVAHHQDPTTPPPVTEPTLPSDPDARNAVRTAAILQIQRNADIRAWAGKVGITVGYKGAIPADVVAAYDTAHAAATEPVAPELAAETTNPHDLQDWSDVAHDVVTEQDAVAAAALDVPEILDYDLEVTQEDLDAWSKLSTSLFQPAETVDAASRPDHELIAELEQKLATAEQARDAALADTAAANASMILALRKWADGQDTIEHLRRVVARLGRALDRIGAANWMLADLRRADASDERRRTRRPLIGIIRRPR